MVGRNSAFFTGKNYTTIIDTSVHLNYNNSCIISGIGIINNLLPEFLQGYRPYRNFTTRAKAELLMGIHMTTRRQIKNMERRTSSAWSLGTNRGPESQAAIHWKE